MDELHRTGYLEPERHWIEVPQLLDPYELADLTQAFDGVGIEHRNRTMMTDVVLMGGSHAYSLSVRAEHVHGAAMILRAYFEINDPTEDVPFTGSCPACDAIVDADWACPTCELNFRTHIDADDVLYPFLREHGGFDDP